MFVEPIPATALVPDAEPSASQQADVSLFDGIVSAFGTAGTALERAQGAERAFESGRSGLQEMVFERARADAILSIASAGASKATQALNTITNMQV